MRFSLAQFLNAGRPALTGEDSDVADVPTAIAGRGKLMREDTLQYSWSSHWFVTVDTFD